MAVLELKDQQPIAAGGQRTVFLHPFDKTKLVKVLKPAESMPKRRTFRSIMDRLMPSTRIRQLRKEYQEYLRLMLNNRGSDFDCPIAHMFGFVTTDIGLGCLTEAVVEPDGTLGQTVGKMVKTAAFTGQDLMLLNSTVARIYAYHIRASDMNASNFVIGHRYDGHALGPRECVLVDGFGDIHAVPVRSMAQWSNRMGLDDSCARLARKTKLKWDAASRQFSI
jgi:hypothetical protein